MIESAELLAARVAAAEFRRVAGRFATGVTITSSAIDDVPVAMTVNSFATVSLDPTLLLTCLKLGSRLLSAIERSEVFAVTVLANDQRWPAQWFANAARPTGAAAFAGIPTSLAPVTGSLVLTGGTAFFDCRVHSLAVQGDHAVVVGEVVACGELRAKPPLLFLGGRYATAQR
jgi:flavin reductase (DIM6/NTAB) family NADH-FMN oxidoreductase RutF